VVFGKQMSPVATLVEPSTRYLLLVGLPHGNHKPTTSLTPWLLPSPTYPLT